MTHSQQADKSGKICLSPVQHNSKMLVDLPVTRLNMISSSNKLSNMGTDESITQLVKSTIITSKDPKYGIQNPQAALNRNIIDGSDIPEKDSFHVPNLKLVNLPIENKNKNTLTGRVELPSLLSEKHQQSTSSKNISNRSISLSPNLNCDESDAAQSVVDEIQTIEIVTAAENLKVSKEPVLLINEPVIDHISEGNVEPLYFGTRNKSSSDLILDVDDGNFQTISFPESVNVNTNETACTKQASNESENDKSLQNCIPSEPEKEIYGEKTTNQALESMLSLDIGNYIIDCNLDAENQNLLLQCNSSEFDVTLKDIGDMSASSNTSLDQENRSVQDNIETRAESPTPHLAEKVKRCARQEATQNTGDYHATQCTSNEPENITALGNMIPTIETLRVNDQIKKRKLGMNEGKARKVYTFPSFDKIANT